MTASTCGSNFDSQLAVFCNDCPTLTCVDGNDDFCGFAEGAQVSWESVATAKYDIYVAGFNGATGQGTLCISVGGDPRCETVECRSDEGACCTGRGPGTPLDCLVTNEEDCLKLDGVYRGDGTECFEDLEDCIPLEVTMESMTAESTADGVMVRWVTATEIDTDAPLFGNGLGLDSIDALEIAMVLEERYGVTLDDDPEENQRVFQSVRSLSNFVVESRKG